MDFVSIVEGLPVPGRIWPALAWSVSLGFRSLITWPQLFSLGLPAETPSPRPRKPVEGVVRFIR